MEEKMNHSKVINLIRTGLNTPKTHPCCADIELFCVDILKAYQGADGDFIDVDMFVYTFERYIWIVFVKPVGTSTVNNSDDIKAQILSALIGFFGLDAFSEVFDPAAAVIIYEEIKTWLDKEVF